MFVRGGDADAMCAHQCPGVGSAYSPALTDADTITDGYIADRETDNAALLKLEMQLSWVTTENEGLKTTTMASTELIGDLETQTKNLSTLNENLTTRNLDLTSRVSDLKKELIEQYSRASAAERRADHAERATRLTDPEELRVMHKKLLEATEEKDAAVRARDEAQNEANSAKLEAQLNLGRLQNAQSTNRRLSADLTVCNATAHNNFLELSKLDATIAARETMIVELEGTLDARNVGAHPSSYSNKQGTPLQSENNKLKSDIVALNSRLDTIRSNMAYNITMFDVAWDGWRLFNCNHANFRDIPDGQNSSYESLSSSDIIIRLLEEWVNDGKFVKEYNDVRRTILQHHRAHERVPQGKGVASYRIKNEFVKADQRRGIPIRY
jgi:predicted RNase H-like nuclease (RuvC/YqgF family)